MNKKIIFTICSNNYLAQALSLGESIEKWNTNVDFRIYLVDKKLSIKNIASSNKHQIIEVDSIFRSDLDELTKFYNIIELNTAVKPRIFKHIFLTENLSNAIYFDPDILVFNSLESIFKNQEYYDFILTPHILSPSDGNIAPGDISFISTGIFNLGFISISKSESSLKILDWWQQKLESGNGHCNLLVDQFYDQLWANLIISFSNKVCIEQNMGMNVAPWNIHERFLSLENDQYIINNKDILLFFHFSGFKYYNPKRISVHKEINLDDRPDLQSIYAYYKEVLHANQFEEFTNIKCYYKTKPLRKNSYLKNKIRSIVLKFLYFIS